MRILTFIVYCLLTGITWGCHKTPIDPPDDPVDTTEITEEYPIEIIWKVPLHPDTIHCRGMYPVMDGNKVYFSRWYNNNPEVIMGLEKATGKKLWEYKGLPDMLSFQYTEPLIDNNLFVSCDRNIYNINTINGQLQWSTEGQFPLMNILPRFYMVNGSVNIVLYPAGQVPWMPLNQLVKLDIQSGHVLDTLVTLKESSENSVDIENVIYHKYKNGNDWILFKNRAKVADFYAYDLTGDSVVWVNYDFNNGYSVVLENPVVYKDNVIFSAGTRLLCYDLDDGSLVWKVDRPSYDINLYKDVIFCYYRKNSEPLIPSYVCAYDAGTGNLLWQTEVTGEAEFSNNFIVYKDKLYFSATYLQCLDVHTGRKLWKYRPPDYKPGTNWDKSVYGEGMVIDQETGYCYISDGFFAFCLNLNNVEVQ